MASWSFWNNFLFPNIDLHWYMHQLLSLALLCCWIHVRSCYMTSLLSYELSIIISNYTDPIFTSHIVLHCLFIILPLTVALIWCIESCLIYLWDSDYLVVYCFLLWWVCLKFHPFYFCFHILIWYTDIDLYIHCIAFLYNLISWLFFIYFVSIVLKSLCWSFELQGWNLSKMWLFMRRACRSKVEIIERCDYIDESCEKAIHFNCVVQSILVGSPWTAMWYVPIITLASSFSCFLVPDFYMLWVMSM